MSLPRDILVVAGLAGLTMMSLLHWVADRYEVPSDSMQPTLFGARPGGDWVLVDKTASAAALRRYDLAVFVAPGETRKLVKRVVAFGDDPANCCLELRDGDLWLGPDAQRLTRAVKEPLACRDLRVPWLRWPDAVEPLADSLAPVPAGTGPLLVPQFESAAAAQRLCSPEVRRAIAATEHSEPGGGWLATLRPIDASYLDVQGRRGVEGAGILVDDIGADLAIHLPGVEALLCGFDLRPDSWVFCWRPAAGTVELWRNGVAVADRRLPTRAAADAEPRRVEYGLLDGHFFFAVDGRDDQLWVEPRRAEWIVADPGPSGWDLPRTRICLGAIGRTPAPLARLQVFHDLHWYRPLEVGVDPKRFSPVRTVPPGHVWLLGDNAADSRDSRAFGPVPLSSFVGRPRLVLGPWPRFHALSR